MQFATFNIRGKPTSIPTLFSILQLDTLCLTETWARELPSSPPLHSIHLSGVTAPNRSRLGAGVSLFSRQPLQLIKKITTPMLQAIIARHKSGITIVGCYVPPGQRLENVSNALSLLDKHIRGTVVLLGDFNARARTWDRAQNVHGTALSKWCSRHHLKVTAPSTPSCRNTSNVDLFLSRGLTLSSCHAEAGSWDSDHKLVSCTLRHGAPWSPPRISLSGLSKPELQQLARSTYCTKLPRLAQELTLCTSPTELEEVSDKVLETLHEPWASVSTRKPSRFRPGWNYRLDKLAKQRAKLLRARARAVSPQLTEEIRLLDRRIARARRTNLRIAQIRQASRLETVSCTEAATLFARNRTPLAANPAPRIDSDTYAEWMGTTQSHSADLSPVKMTVPEDFRDAIKKALSKAHNNRAPGPDGVISEVFQFARAEISEVLFNLWQCAGALGHIPHMLLRGTVVTLYKKGDPTDPSNFRPITILSHLRKILSIAVNTWIMESYHFHPSQYGFSPKSGTEIATLHAAALQKSGHTHLAILDLKQAYPSVRRDVLLAECHNRLPKGLVPMVHNLLLDIHFTVMGQQFPNTRKLTMGVPQGDPASPTLYNIFMDTFLEAVNQTPCPDSDTPAICYADDVLLASRSAEGLQALLDTATKWAQDHFMTWATHKSFIIAPENTILSLDAKPLQVVTTTTYLGSSISTLGITDKAILDRIKACTIKLRTWQRRESVSLRLHRATKLALVTKFLLPAVDFGIHVAEISPETRHAATDLERKAMQWITTTTARNTVRAHAITRVPPFMLRRTLLQHARLQRIFTAAAQAKWTPSSNSRASNQSVKFYNLAVKHPQLAPQAVASNMPMSTADIGLTTDKKIPCGNTRKFKSSTLSQYWKLANIGHRRIIPEGNQAPPIYSHQKLSYQDLLFADRWYLNTLSKLSPQETAELHSILSQAKITEELANSFERLAHRNAAKFKRLSDNRCPKRARVSRDFSGGSESRCREQERASSKNIISKVRAPA